MHTHTRTAPPRTAPTRAALARAALNRAALIRAALALLTAAALTLGFVQPAAAEGMDRFHFVRGSVTAANGSVCIDAYVEPAYGVTVATLEITLNGELRDTVQTQLSTSRRANWTDSIKYDRCLDVTGGPVAVSATATARTQLNGGVVAVPVLDQIVQVAERPSLSSAPGKPSLRATGATSMRVAWDAPSGRDDITGYQVIVSEGGAVVRTLDTTSTSVTVAGLESRLSYAVAIRSRNDAGYSAASPAAGLKLEVPGKPAKPAAKVTGASSLRVAWTAPKTAGAPAITGYSVRVSAGGTVVRTLTVEPTQRSVTVTGLNGRTRYSVDVRARNGVGYSSASTKTTVTTKDWTAAATWAGKKYGTFSTVVVSGTGNDVITLPRTAETGILTARHSGSSNFAVTVRDGVGNFVEQPMQELGNYSGTTLFGMDPWRGTPRKLHITASGAWSIQIGAVRTAAELPTSGKADGVYLYGGGTTSLAVSHSGFRNFVMHTYASGAYGRSSLVNSYGAYRGTATLKKGPSVVEILADGAWTAARR